MSDAPMRPRRGFTLVELMVVLVLFTIIGGGIISVMRRQQAFYTAASERGESESQIRTAAALLPTDLRALTSNTGTLNNGNNISDIVAASDSAIEFRQFYGMSVTCTAGGNTLVNTPPQTLASGNVLTTFARVPSPGDSVLIFDDGATSASSDDSWKAYRISTTVGTGVITGVNLCPAVSGFTTVSDATTNTYRFTLLTNVSATSGVGSPIRFFTHARYSLYRASDNNYYLGYCSSCTGGGNAQAIAGPFQPYAASGAGTTGVGFKYYDKTGAVTALLTDIARIDVVIRANPRTTSLSGQGGRASTDSVTLSIALRNRP